MQLKAGLSYLAIHVLAALSAFALLAVYTRWLPPKDYGAYSTLIAVSASLVAVAFNWLFVGLMRYWHDQSVSLQAMRGVLMLVVAIIPLPIAVITLAYSVWSGHWALGLSFMSLFILGAIYAAYQRIQTITQQSTRYVWNELLRIVTMTGLGFILVWLGYGWQGAMIATGVGFLLPVLFARQFWLWPSAIDRCLLKELLQYGLPLSLTFMLIEVIHVSDRVLLSHLAGFAAAGEYAVIVSLPFQLGIMLANSINMAAYPLIIQALEKQGLSAAQRQLEHYILIFIGTLLPSLLGLLVVSEDFIPYLIGDAFVKATLLGLPLACLAIFLDTLYLFHTSLAFQLARQTRVTVKITLLAASLNVLLNLILIPLWGVSGALIASVLAYLSCVLYGSAMARHYFRLPMPWLELLKLMSAAVCMWLLLKALPLEHGWWQGLIRVGVGMACYALLVWFWNVGGVRLLLGNYRKKVQLSV